MWVSDSTDRHYTVQVPAVRSSDRPSLPMVAAVLMPVVVAVAVLSIVAAVVAALMPVVVAVVAVDIQPFLFLLIIC